jgi:hypothetical protein
MMKNRILTGGEDYENTVVALGTNISFSVTNILEWGYPLQEVIHHRCECVAHSYFNGGNRQDTFEEIRNYES